MMSNETNFVLHKCYVYISSQYIVIYPLCRRFTFKSYYYYITTIGKMERQIWEHSPQIHVTFDITVTIQKRCMTYEFEMYLCLDNNNNIDYYYSIDIRKIVLLWKMIGDSKRRKNSYTNIDRKINCFRVIAHLC